MKSSPRTPYDELDAAIVERIRGGAYRFCEIWPPLDKMAMEHIPAGSRSGPDRVVDRRLQALSRQHKIRFWRGNWEVL
jgi:hypothetical protein